ncbi:uncharacterized protein LOC135813779 isoform X1 [Sycon ciliatum]|uniref:uncharacterized protein LOC135813779 isoform X1 n=1 Tax=Sycon ciliatum TaxID=27933 RepID=UPI0031F68B21
MADRVRYNIAFLLSNLDASLILELLLENDVLDVDEYDTASSKENVKSDLTKYVVRLMLKKTEEQVDTFLRLIQHSQPHVAEHVASTMAKRRDPTASGKTDHPTKPMSADHEPALGSSSALPEWVNFRTISNIDRMERLKRIRDIVAESSKRVHDVGCYLLDKEFPDSPKAAITNEAHPETSPFSLFDAMTKLWIEKYDIPSGRDMHIAVQNAVGPGLAENIKEFCLNSDATMMIPGQQKTQQSVYTEGGSETDQQLSSSRHTATHKQATSALATTSATSMGTSRSTRPTTAQVSKTSSHSSNSSLPDLDEHFTGRDDIVTKISHNILTTKSKSSSTRVKSLVAPPGFGKTSVAIAVGHVCRNAGCRVEFFDLRGVAGVDAVQAMIQNRLETNPALSGTTGKATKSTDAMDDDGGKHHMLCILDNAEDAIQAGADKDFQLQDVIQRLLGLQHNVHILLTSRVYFDLHAAQFKLQQHRLVGLTKVCAVGLLRGLCVEGSVSIEDARRLVDHCGNVPLAVRITAGLLQGGRKTPTMLLSLFQELGLDVFNDDRHSGLKPNHRILKLLELAYNTLQQDDKESFHALSQLRSSFTSDCACVMVGLPATDANVVHLVRFDPLIKICFLDYNAYLKRYSLQPFVAEFGRYKCPEDKQRMYQQRMCKHFLGFVNDVDHRRGCGAEKAMYWSHQLLQEAVNIKNALSVVDLLSDDELLPFSRLATCIGLFAALFGKSTVAAAFAERFQRLDNAPLSVQVDGLCASVLCRFTSAGKAAGSDTNFDDLELKAQTLLQKCNKEPTGEQSQLQLILIQLSLESCRTHISRTMGSVEGQAELSQETLSRLQVVYQRVTTTLGIGLATGVTECALKLIQLYCSTLLNKDIPNVQVVEDLAERVISSYFLSQDGAVLSCAGMYNFLLQCIVVILGKVMSGSCSSEWIISPSLITTLGIPRCEWKHVPTAVRRSLNVNDDYTTVSALRIQHYLYCMDDDTVSTLLDMYLDYMYNIQYSSLVVNGRAHTTPTGLTLPAQRPYNIVMDYVRRWCNGSNPADHTTALINNCSQNKIPDVEVMQSCILMARVLQTFENTVFATVDISKLFPALKSLVNDLSAYLPSNCATGLSVSGIVYLPPTTGDSPLLYISLIAALHHQSKRGQVSTDHHIALREWCPRVAACFVCYDLDNITACPRCGMAYLCGKHRQTDEHQSEHNQHCAMLAALRRRRLQAS